MLRRKRKSMQKDVWLIDKKNTPHNETVKEKHSSPGEEDGGRYLNAL